MPVTQIKLALRHLFRNRFYSIINIFGLSIGISVAIIIFITVNHEYRYDRFHENRENIYRLEAGDWALMPPSMADAVSSEFPEIKERVRFSVFELRDALVSYEDKKMRIDHYLLADENLFEVFSFRLIQGNAQEALVTPFSVVLTRSKARELFGESDPVGKTIRLHNQYEVVVTGIIEDRPDSSIPFEAIGSFETLYSLTGKRDYGISEYWNFQTYFLLENNIDVEALSGKIRAFMAGFPEFQDNCPHFFLRPLKEIYFSNRIKYEGGSIHGNRDMMSIFIAIAVFILVIAIINYVNLSTARSGLRARETGIRKINGAGKGRLLFQFLFEGIILSFFAFFVALILVELLLPVFSRIINIPLETSVLSEPLPVLIMLAGVVLIGVLAGIYPAAHIARFDALDAVRGELTTGKRGVLVRKMLIITQFIIATGLIFATQVVDRQVDYMKNADPGFNKEHVIAVNLNSAHRKSADVFKESLLKSTAIKDVTFTNALPGSVSWQESFMINNEQKQFTYLPVDANYIEFMDLELTKGRDFNPLNPADRDTAYIFNETAIKFFGLEDPVGFTNQNDYGVQKIIGVIKDFHFNSLHAPVAPLALVWRPVVCSKALIRIHPQRINEAVDLIETTWKDMAPDDIFEYRFLDESFDQLYKNDRRFGTLFLYFSVIAIFIACMGLFGMVSFMTLSRKKEISIRKVNGAGENEILGMFLKETLKWILVANIVAIPLTAWLMSQWLHAFPYRAGFNISMFVITLLTTAFIAVFTVFFHTLKAARANPVDALYNE